ncbi:MMPL family transporter [Streptomyces sp. NPDC048269]|uniref:MMPL family transporter n=1 Tax=Streptomyces sp. NPDC048269 TaxID=3155753 RepID=UPI00343728FD
MTTSAFRAALQHALTLSRTGPTGRPEQTLPATKQGAGGPTPQPDRHIPPLWTRIVLLTATLIGCAAALLAHGTSDRLSQGGWTPASADSMRADSILAGRFAAGPPHLILLTTTSGTVDSPAANRAGTALTHRIAADPRTVWVRSHWPTAQVPSTAPPRTPGTQGAQGTSTPFLRSADHRRAALLIRFRGDEAAVRTAAADTAATATQLAGPLRVSASGEAVVRSETERLSDLGLRRAELVATPLVLAVLLWVFGSAAAALLPVLIGLLAVTTTTAFLRLLTEVTSVSIFALSITTALGFGLAVDYSLLIVSRYREELHAGRPPHDAMSRTLRTAGRAVAFSAATIAISLCALLAFPLPLLRSLAYGGAAVVVLCAGAALLVLPALLLLLGKRIDQGDVFARWRRPRPTHLSAGTWYRVATTVTRRPALTALGVLALLLLLAAPVTQVRFGMFDERVLPASSPVAQSTRQLRADFGGDAVDATAVVLPHLTPDRHPALDSYARRLSQVNAVRRVDTATGSYHNGRAVSGPGPRTAAFADDDTAWAFVSSDVAEPLSPDGIRLAEAVRRVTPPPGIHPLVTGPGARLADTQHALSARLPLAAAGTAAAILLLLLPYTRSVLIPIKALLLNTLSLAATAGVLVAVFQQGCLASWLGDFTTGGITDVILPSLMFCVAFGLSMDYEVFLLSRIVEEHRDGTPTSEAVATGLQRTGRLFTAAAAVFAIVMGCLALSDLVLLKIVGTGLAVAVLLDCTLIRALLVPATMQLIGRANWWLPRLNGLKPPCRRGHPVRFVRAKVRR